MVDSDSPVHGDRPTAFSAVGIKDHKELSAVAFSRTRMPMVLSDAHQEDCPIVLANQAFLDLTGYSAGEVIGRNCRFLQGPATSPSAVAELRFAIGEGRGADVELLNYRKDGSAFWNQLHLSPVLDDNGALAYFFASQIDVTAYRNVQRLEASEHRLLMEVDHRTKNTLAVVDSIVRLSNASDPARYAASVQSRVQSLSQAHALLAQARWQTIMLRDLIEAQLTRFRHAGISLNGDDVSIAPADVQPLSLIFHKLVVNAVTHGSLSRDNRGALVIEWNSGAKPGGFCLQWIETGGSPEPERVSKGFGTIILTAIVEKQLSGKIRRSWSREGLTVGMDVPGR